MWSSERLSPSTFARYVVFQCRARHKAERKSKKLSRCKTSSQFQRHAQQRTKRKDPSIARARFLDLSSTSRSVYGRAKVVPLALYSLPNRFSTSHPTRGRVKAPDGPGAYRIRCFNGTLSAWLSERHTHDLRRWAASTSRPTRGRAKALHPCPPHLMWLLQRHARHEVERKQGFEKACAPSRRRDNDV